MSEPPTIDPANAFGVGGHGWDADVLRQVTPLQESARRTAAALRRMAVTLETTSATVEELDELTSSIDALTETLPSGARVVPGSLDDPTVVYQAHRLRERSPFIGRANPVAPPLVVEFGRESVSCVVTLGTLYEGPPGKLHGGYIAGIFDELLGAAQTYSGRAGMTGRLTVHYRKPTPLGVELRVEAWVESVNGRKIVCKGTLHAGEVLCAEAEGLFIAVDPALLIAAAGESPG